MLKKPVAKKTKKEKLLAEKRRLLALVSEQKNFTDKPPVASFSRLTNTFTFNPVSQSQGLGNRPLGQSKESYDYVASDLKKIAVLTTFAICAQVVLWYLLEKHLILLF